MIGFIKNLFSGVLSFFIGLFGGKKSQENKPSIAASKPAVAQQSKGKIPSTSSAKPRKRSGYFMELDESEEIKPVNGNQQAKAAATKTPEPVAAAKPAKPEPAKVDQAAASEAAAKIELVQTDVGIKAEPAKRESSSPASMNGQGQTETTFAPKYLAPASSSNRRRPGPNMNSFLDMARQVKTPG